MSNNNLSPKCLSINGKDIKVVDDHQYVLLIWGQLFQTFKKPYVLVSIDYHPDTNPAFWLYAYQKAMALDPNRENELVKKFQKKMMASIDPNNIESIQGVMDEMRNDEHISTALDLGYLKDYHMINCMEKHEYLKGNHYLVPAGQFGSLEDCLFNAIGLPLENIMEKDIILDIDLDYFLNAKNFKLDLNKNKVFGQLVKQAQIITVARSRTYFNFFKKDKSTLEECEQNLIELIEKILENREMK